MLCLTRYIGDSIVIVLPDERIITVKLTKHHIGSTSGKRRISLAIDAPNDVKIYREEIYQDGKKTRDHN